MLIEILKDTETTSHSLKAGDVVNMREQDALKLVQSKRAKQTKKKAK